MVVGGRELIDTLWNVNYTDFYPVWHEKTRINRYIMECKFELDDSNVNDVERINRYIMECK